MPGEILSIEIYGTGNEVRDIEEIEHSSRTKENETLAFPRRRLARASNQINFGCKENREFSSIFAIIFGLTENFELRKLETKLDPGREPAIS